MVELHTSRFGVRQIWEFTTIQEAAKEADLKIEENTSCPVKIIADGKEIWRNEGPFSGSYDSLREMANYT